MKILVLHPKQQNNIFKCLHFFCISVIIFHFLFFFYPSKKSLCMFSGMLKPDTLCLMKNTASAVWLGNNEVKSKDLHLIFLLLHTSHYFKHLSHGLICCVGYWITLQSYPCFSHNVLQPELWNHLVHWGLLDLCEPNGLWNFSHWSKHSGYTDIQYSEN